MSDDVDKIADPISALDTRILKVTAEDLSGFLNEKAPGRLCTYCGKAEYVVPNDPLGKSAAVITTPIPHVKGMGAWLYMIICPECGHTCVFNAHVVSQKISGSV